MSLGTFSGGNVLVKNAKYASVEVLYQKASPQDPLFNSFTPRSCGNSGCSQTKCQKLQEIYNDTGKEFHSPLSTPPPPPWAYSSWYVDVLSSGEVCKGARECVNAVSIWGQHSWWKFIEVKSPNFLKVDQMSRIECLCMTHEILSFFIWNARQWADQHVS